MWVASHCFNHYPPNGKSLGSIQSCLRSLLGTGGAPRLGNLCAAKDRPDVRQQDTRSDNENHEKQGEFFPHLLTRENPVCAFGTHEPPCLVEVLVVRI